MKNFSKFALGAAMLAGATAIVAASPAEARVTVGIGIGVPGYYGPAYVPRYSCDPYSRFYDPYYCGRFYGPGYYAPSYYAPSFSFGYSNWGRGRVDRDDFDRRDRGGDRGDFRGRR